MRLLEDCTARSLKNAFRLALSKRLLRRTNLTFWFMSRERRPGAALCRQALFYFGNLHPWLPQFDTFKGLALQPQFEHDIQHDARHPLPLPDDSVDGFQSEDVFEHLEYERVSSVFDEIFRCLTSGGMFRLSMPDYNSPLLRSRSLYGQRRQYPVRLGDGRLGHGKDERRTGRRLFGRWRGAPVVSDLSAGAGTGCQIADPQMHIDPIPPCLGLSGPQHVSPIR